jgi:septum formation protein
MLNKKLKNHRLILASSSPRRQQFLKDLGLDFIIRTKDVKEVYPKYLHGKEITNYLAELKAKAFVGELKENDILITADTIVRFNGKVLGKPKDLEGAKVMLNELSGRAHEVISSICIRTLDKKIMINDTTDVYFKKLTTDEIDFYVDNFKPLDKAGSYGIQEWLGYIGVKKIKGCFFNVMGFPVHKFYKEMMNL